MDELTASLCSVCKSLRNDAVAIAVCRHSGSLIARSRTPCARQFSGARVESARRAISEPPRPQSAIPTASLCS
eukprot:4552773-Lingulodinium_polyedra.AAC.1